MKKLVAIGGGHIGRLGPVSTTPIDKEIIRLSAKIDPKLLFIPTASSDSESYIAFAKKYFGDLGCKVDVLRLIKEKRSPKEIKEKIFKTDIIYVGGGDTLKMMRVWRRTGFDKVLKAAYNKGIVLSGKSAGSICWFDFGHSNSLKYREPKNCKYIRIRGLGLIKGNNCPHYDEVEFGATRKQDFESMINKAGGFGIAIENDCAIEFIDGKYFKVISSKPGAAAFKVYKRGGKVVSQKLEQKTELSPIKELYKKNLTPA